MSCPYRLEEHALFKKLLNDHELIKSKITEATTTSEKRALLPWLIQEVEDKQHYQEEILIYPKLFKNPRLSEGGPYCTLYFDIHISNPPESLATRLTGTTPDWQGHQNIFKTQHTPILIPLKEHRSLRHILIYLSQNSPSLDDKEFEKLFQSYQQLLFHHLTKEARCFFRVCQTLLSESELNMIDQLWRPVQ